MALAEPEASRPAGAAGVVTKPPVPPVKATLSKVAVVVAVDDPLTVNRPM